MGNSENDVKMPSTFECGKLCYKSSFLTLCVLLDFAMLTDDKIAGAGHLYRIHELFQLSNTTGSVSQDEHTYGPQKKHDNFAETGVLTLQQRVDFTFTNSSFRIWVKKDIGHVGREGYLVSKEEEEKKSQ